jgi:plasmid replication initiation protein
MARIPHEQLDLFIASASDISPKAHRDLMARCWFSLSKNKRTIPIEHRSQDSWVKVSGSAEHGIATIFDNDILIFVIAQLMAAVNDGRKTGRKFQFTGYEYFKFIGRKKIGGKAYTDIWKSLERLKDTKIETDIRMGNSKRNHIFNWLSEVKQIVEGNRHRGYEVVIPEWLYSSVVENKMVLTIDNDYFSIKGGLERWLYMFGRKSTGHQQSSWTESTKSIYEKSGSLGSFSEFNRQIKNIIEKDDLVGYQIGLVSTHSKHRTDRALAFHNRDLIGAPVRDKQSTSGAKKYRKEI